MPTLPVIALETEADELLATHHVGALTWVEERAAVLAAALPREGVGPIRAA